MSDWTYIHDSNKRNEFFGEVKYRLTASGDYEVELTVMPDPKFGFELGMAALAIDGSKSMMQPFAAHLPAIARKKRNQVHPIAQDLALHLSKNSNNQCALAYWACGGEGGDVEPVGIFAGPDIESYWFDGPENWGGGTKLTPIVEYFWEHVFSEVDGLGVAVILTDGAWDNQDHQNLQEFTRRMASEVASGSRKLMKCVVLAWKTSVNEDELEKIESRLNDLDDIELDDDIDIWDKKWVHEMADYNEVFIELCKELSLEMGGEITDSSGNQLLASDAFNFGIEFQMPGNSSGFTLSIEGLGDFEQSIG